MFVWIRCFKIIRPLRAPALCENDRYGNMTEWIQSSKDGSGDYNTEASDEWLEKTMGCFEVEGSAIFAVVITYGCKCFYK